jgi:YfiR/HmsC-like
MCGQARSNRGRFRGPSRNRPGGLSLILAAVLPGLLMTARAESSANGEYEVKAAFLFHFAQFVEWPPDAFQNPTSPLIYCTIGEDPFHGGLDESLRGKSVGARTIEVRHVKQPQEVHGCQILFIAAGEKKRAGDVMATTVGHPILTVGENEGFVQSGGMIGFCLEENKFALKSISKLSNERI